MAQVPVQKTDSIREHVLVCISTSPSSPYIISTAGKMAKAFDAEFTALYVKTPSSGSEPDADKKRLEENLRLAKELGADCVTIEGNEIASQIAEFSRLSGVTKIVLGRSLERGRHFFRKTPLNEQLIELIPSADIHIIPDAKHETRRRLRMNLSLSQFRVYPKDILIMILVLAASSGIGLLFGYFGIDESTIMAMYILGVLIVALFTRGYTPGILASLFSVLAFNFFFAEPEMSFQAYDSHYFVTFSVMLLISILTCTLVVKMKDHAKVSAQSAFKTKVLFETNQLLQKAKSEEDILNVTATQLTKLLSRVIVIYPSEDGTIGKGRLYSPENATETDGKVLFSEQEREAASWVFENHHRAGKMTERFPKARCLYLSIRIHSHVYGVVGIEIPEKPLDYFENSILLSIVGECALALENRQNELEKEQTAIRARHVQRRADFLRTFSHDLRTPLTTISGNASNLLTNYEKLDEATRHQVFSDIYDDSQWLINLVENLLSVTRIEDGRMHLNLSVQLLEEVIDEAIRNVERRKTGREIMVHYEDDMLLVRIDPKMIIQVLVNLVDNAIKYTEEGTKIQITARKSDHFVTVSVADEGKGIPDEQKPKVFDMFFTGNTSISDSRRSLGLGLFLCRSIVTAHGGEISVSDNSPHGTVFSFTIPSDEVSINE